MGSTRLRGRKVAFSPSADFINDGRRALTARGAHVVVAGRSGDKVQAAIERIRSETPSVSLEAGIVDLTSLASVAVFAKGFGKKQKKLDLLINNTGVMVPHAGGTADGFETQFGVHFVAHFALTGHLFGRLAAAPAARVVTMSSIGHPGAVLDFDKFRLEKPCDLWREYGQSKLTGLVFALEFDRRCATQKNAVVSVAAHPGVSQTEFTRNLGDVPAGIEMIAPAEGAAPALVAATAPDVAGGQHWGSDGLEEGSGKPGLALVDAAALKDGVAERLWSWAEGATGRKHPRQRPDAYIGHPSMALYQTIWAPGGYFGCYAQTQQKNLYTT